MDKDRRRRTLASEKIHIFNDLGDQKTSRSRKHRLDVYKQLYEENRQKIKMPSLINHPLNYKRGMKWAGFHCDAESMKFAESIIENTIYVSFGYFMERLDKICSTFVAHYAKKPHKIILIIPEYASKSNFWVALLVYPYLKDIIYDVQFNVTDAYNTYIRELKNIACVIADDCVYTGSQIIGSCLLSAERVEYDGREKEPPETSREWIAWKKKVSHDTNEIIKKIDPDHFSVSLLIPFMSTLAQDRIRPYKFINISKSVIVFKIFRDLVDMSEFNVSVMREFESTFQYHPHISCIYFDHKIADAISTFNKIYMMAPIFNCGSIRKTVCFIEGCESLGEKVADFDIYKVYVNVETILGSHACPRTFYQTFNYLYRGRKIAQGTPVSTIFEY